MRFPQFCCIAMQLRVNHSQLSERRPRHVRDVLTGVAILLLVVLAAAMGVPHLVNWDNHRERIAASLSDALGTKVSVSGPLSVTLLPVPRLKLSNVQLAEQGFLSGDIRHVRTEASIPNLLRGELRLTSLLIAGATIKVDPAQKPNLFKLHQKTQAQVSIGALQIEQSSVALVGAPESQPPLLLIKAGEMEATSLSGPFKGVFAIVLNGRSQSVRFSTGALSEEGLRVRALLENEQASLRSEWDGALTFASAEPAFSGRVTASGVSTVEAQDRPVSLVWRMTGRAGLAGKTARIDDIDLTIGSGDRQISLKGNASVDLETALKAEIVLQARQIDLDRLLSDAPRGRTTIAPRELLLSLRPEGFRSNDMLPLRADLKLTAQSIILGSEVLTAPEIGLTLTNGVASLSHLEAQLPGNVSLSLKQQPEGASGVTDAMLAMDGQDLTRFRAWFTGVAPAQRAARKAFSVKGDVTSDRDVVTFRNATVTYDAMVLTGGMRLHKNSQTPIVEGEIELRDFDLLTLSDLMRNDSGIAGPDLDVRVSGKALKVGRQPLDRLAVRIRKKAELISVSDAEIAGPDGLLITGQLELGASALSSEMIIKAKNADEILELAERLNIHSGTTNYLRKRSALLAPVDLNVKMRPAAGRGQQLSVTGSLARSTLALEAELSEAGMPNGPETLKLKIDNPKSEELLAQLGAAPLPGVVTGPARLSLTGGWPRTNDKAVQWVVSGSVAGADFSLDGQKTQDKEQPADGRLTLKAKDIYPLASSLAITFPEVQPGQDLSLVASVDLRGFRITLRDFDLRSGGETFAGEIAFDLQRFGRISGQIRTDRLSADSLSPLISGTEQEGSATSLWSRLPFQASAQPSLPGDLWIEANSLTLPDGTVLSQPGFVFRFDRNLAYIEYGRGKFRDAPFEVGATIRRTDKLVTLAGRLSTQRVDLSRLATEGVLNGLMSLDLEFNGAGDTAHALVASLAGTGRASFADVAVSVPEPAALSALLAAPPDDAQSLLPAVLARQLAAAPRNVIRMPDGPSQLNLAGGQLRLGPLAVEQANTDITLALGADLRSLTQTPVVSLALRRSPNRWDGPPPSFALSLRPPARGGDVIDASRLSNGLLALQIRKELDRIDVLEQDQRELENANRRLQRSQSEVIELRNARQRLESLRQEAAREAAQDAENQRRRSSPPRPASPPIR
jgi:hypothetical protein